MALPFIQQLLPARTKPQVVPDGTVPQVGARSGRYMEQIVQNIIPGKQALADEGSYFVATNATLGTPVAATITTAFSDTTTSVAFVIQNNDSPSNTNAKRIYLDFLSQIVTTVPASSTSVRYAVKLDNISRVPTANQAFLTAGNANFDDGTASISKVWGFSGGYMTVPASSGSARVVASGAIGGLPILCDDLVVQFGGVDMAAMGTSGTASRKVSVAPPIIIGPQQYAVIYQWVVGNATTAGQYEYSLGWWER